MVDWKKHPVECTECGAGLERRLYRPLDSKRIKHFFCNRSCKGAWQMRQHPVSDDWLRQKYEVERLSAVDIAFIVGRDAKSVWTWLRNAGIKTRRRGADVRQHFKKGSPSLWRGRKHSDETKAKIRELRIKEGRYPLDNGRPYWEGKKGKSHPTWKGGLTPERQSFYSSRAWKSAVVAVWHRADAKCERCRHDSRAKDRTFHIHHIVSFQVRELRTETTNLALLCSPCHRFIHSRRNTNREFIGDEGSQPASR